jgi:DNA-directed RNA polymerase
MRRFNNFLNNEYTHEFNTYLPIQLDGTCNSFQHLTLLSNESKLFEALNLFESSKNKDPKDFYQHIVNQINIHLEKGINYSKSDDEKESYNRLLKLGLSRSNIKYVIMTKPYNAKGKTLVKYILNTLVLSHVDKKIVKDNDGNDITINIQ